MDINTQYQYALWYTNLKATTNDTFFPLYTNKDRYLVLMGGGGSGKSIFAGRKILERVQSEKGHRILVVRKVAKTIRPSCFDQLKAQIGQHYNISDWTINKTDMVMTYKNGSQILFAGLDDVEKLKSIYGITGIWIEEASELDESDFNQLDIRLRGETTYYKQIIIAFNPIDVNHWLKKRFFDKKHPNATTHHSTYKDNRFLDDEAKQVLEAYKGTDPYYYTVYCLGQWGVFGKTIFDAQKISERLSKIKEPIKQGSFCFDYDGLKITNIEWVDDPDGFVRIYKEPIKGFPYVGGGDTAGEGSDFFTSHILDNTTGEQVAVLKHQFDEDIFARQLYCLGMYYNKALLAPETNFSTYPVKELERLGYTRLYAREKEDTFTHGIVKSYGFKTTSLTRPVIISCLVTVVREGVDTINDKETLEEMLTFVRNEKGRPEAQNGAHDDLIMGLAIAHYIRPQQRYLVLETPEAPKPKLIDQLQKNKQVKSLTGR
jgi:phage terminase large subunit